MTKGYPLQISAKMKEEKDYESFILALLWGSAINAQAEDPTNLGKLDIMIETADTIYIIELKKDSAEKAVEQIKGKKYYQKFAKLGKNIILIGLEIDANERNLKRFLEETLEINGYV